MTLFLSFFGFTALVAIISYLKTRNIKETSSDGYFLGGRSLTAGVIAGSLLLTNLSTEQIVGLNGSAYQSCLSVMVWETLAAGHGSNSTFFITKIFKRRVNYSSWIFSKTL